VNCPPFFHYACSSIVGICIPSFCSCESISGDKSNEASLQWVNDIHQSFPPILLLPRNRTRQQNCSKSKSPQDCHADSFYCWARQIRKAAAGSLASCMRNMRCPMLLAEALLSGWLWSRYVPVPVDRKVL
jgi:hypothetical protein